MEAILSYPRRSRATLRKRLAAIVWPAILVPLFFYALWFVVNFTNAIDTMALIGL